MVFCTNCQTEIDDSKMFLHEGFCKKNIKYCFQCKEKIPIDEFEEHLESHNKKNEQEKKEETNNTINEENNNNINDNNDNNDNNDEINSQCQYCSLLLLKNELEEHEKMCGARTVQCDICGKYIQTRFINQHYNVIHDTGFDDDNKIKEKKEEYNKKKQIKEDEILARKLAEEYNRHSNINSFYNSFRNF